MAHEITWQKSSFSSGGDSSNCVEIAASQEALWLRESDEPGTVIETSATQLAAFIRHFREM
ncbi:DUF397 domain-containing protein [Streptomyces montanus]|uniref:DUF397 domain-containing protein n=1 Tax=Streptomyces montanus TaxID=2580423 RepID=A0A5R9FYB6_9ACTN|nr:DUF397 domain-containing protein [Streptomyces montanus]TLS46930.1 DUF397 domain-containing protein [Streptomyces montanus]